MKIPEKQAELLLKIVIDCFDLLIKFKNIIIDVGDFSDPRMELVHNSLQNAVTYSRKMIMDM